MRNTKLYFPSMVCSIKLQLFFLFVFILIFHAREVHAGWFGPSDMQECLDEYAVPAKSEEAARLAAVACKHSFTDRPKTTEEVAKWYSNRAWAKCVFKSIESVGSDLGAKILAKQCQKK